GVTPHVAQNTTRRRSAIDGRTTRHPGYGVSQQKRKLVEEIFGWLKTIALLRKTRHRGVRRVGWMFTFAAAVYNLVRIRNLTWTEAGTCPLRIRRSASECAGGTKDRPSSSHATLRRVPLNQWSILKFPHPARSAGRGTG